MPFNKHLENVRNFSVCSHVDAGKTSLCDTLLACGKLLADKDAGTKRMMSAKSEEKERGITIVSSGATVDTEFEGKSYKFNVVDTPGHSVFGANTSCALRITDGAIILIDAVE